MSDLRHHPPRRWSERIDGICWLPRLIDKARAHDAGTLGHYFFGQSPVDADLLKAGRIGYDDVLEAARSAPDDAGVLAFLEARSAGAGDRMRAWTANPGLIDRFTFALVDADEGYTTGPFATIVRALPGDAIAEFLRKVLPCKVKPTPT